jgi:hypothetical protein
MTTLRPRASLKLPRSVNNALDLARGIVHAMTDNPHFPAPEPPLEVVRAAIHDAFAAQVATLSRTCGTAQARNYEFSRLLVVLQEVRAYVQKVADQNPEIAGAIIESAMLRVHRSTAYAKPRFHLEDGPVSGSVKVTAESVRGAVFYEFQQSVDGGETWVKEKSTPRSKITVPGFSPGQTVKFRFRAITRQGEGNWSQPRAIVVV